MRPLVVHIVYRFDTGGLENGVVNLINNMPENTYRHAIVSLTEITDFRLRVLRKDVEFYALNKKDGHAFWLYPRLFKLFRKLRPAIVHTRNLAALEVLVPAWAAGVRVRVHGEHGRDVGDLSGNNRTYQYVRRFYKPFVSHYVALSRDLAEYLFEKIMVPRRRVSQVYNGVDTLIFHPASNLEGSVIVGCPFSTVDHWVVGTVGRMQVVKDQLTLAHAFIRALEIAPVLKKRMRLVMVGDGVLRMQCQALLDAAGLSELAWLPGERSDVPGVMRGLQCFVLPSLAEGISNTILEAMASGLPVIATNVGGNSDLVVHGETGEIVPAADVNALAHSIVRLASAPHLASQMGQAGRRIVEEKFSMHAMVSTYQGLYDRLLAKVSGIVPLLSSTSR